MSASQKPDPRIESIIDATRPPNGDVHAWAAKLAQLLSSDELHDHHQVLSTYLDTVMDDLASSPFSMGSAEYELELVKVQQVGQHFAVVEYALEEAR